VQKDIRRSYEDVLRELVCLDEVSRADPDSIDRMWYQYGLEMYGDVPLIEPLEEDEQPAFHTLVVAIDVSGSCMSEDIMGRFWGETYQFLQELKNREIAGEVVLIQCDDEIKKEEHFSIDQLPSVKPESVKVCGAGGTSFVPVFTRIRELREKGSIIDGLLYLSDGYGTFPEEKADYPVYFVLPGKKYGEENMPYWVQSVYLDE
jgi:predicted metal-dependent peptidase